MRSQKSEFAKWQVAKTLSGEKMWLTFCLHILVRSKNEGALTDNVWTILQNPGLKSVVKIFKVQCQRFKKKNSSLKSLLTWKSDSLHPHPPCQPPHPYCPPLYTRTLRPALIIGIRCKSWGAESFSLSLKLTKLFFCLNLTKHCHIIEQIYCSTGIWKGFGRHRHILSSCW